MAHIMMWSDRPEVFGAEQINHAIMCAVARAGHQSTFVQGFARHHLIDEREALGIHHEWLEPDDVYELDPLPRQLTDHDEPRAILERTRPDLIAFSDSCPFSNLTAKQVAAELGIPYMTTIHCIDPEWWTTYAHWLPQLHDALERAEQVVAVSSANLEEIREHAHLDADAGRVIFNGRPAAFFAPSEPGTRQRIRAELGIPEDAVVCLTVARLGFSKGYQYQLDALARLQRWEGWPQLHFVWAGEGHMRPRLTILSRLFGGEDRVHLLGLRNDVPDLLEAADIFVLPSQYEGMPLGVLEAMARGLPVIATAVAGTPEALGGTGRLLPDPAQAPIAEPLADAIRELAADPALRRRLGEAARVRANEHFTLSRMESNYLALFDRLLDARTAPHAASR
jgi:glycosyltransferase involved in cell wall biosynthesis